MGRSRTFEAFGAFEEIKFSISARTTIARTAKAVTMTMEPDLAAAVAAMVCTLVVDLPW